MSQVLKESRQQRWLRKQRTIFDRLYKEEPSVVKTFRKEEILGLDEVEVLMKLTPRHECVAIEGTCTYDGDFVNQEMAIAAWASKDPVMTDALRQPKTATAAITKPDGTQEEITYKNPLADLHIITTESCYPELFHGRPLWEWDAISRQIKPGVNKSYRDIGKFLPL